MSIARPMIVFLCLSASAAGAAPSPDDSPLRTFLSRWSQGPFIRAADVEELYAPRVRYYGHAVDRQEVLRQKRMIARRWPDRAYSVLPRSTVASCNPERTRCHVTAVVDWTATNPDRARRSAGGATLALDLVRLGGGLKIVAESGQVIAQRHCQRRRCRGFTSRDPLM